MNYNPTIDNRPHNNPYRPSRQCQCCGQTLPRFMTARHREPSYKELERLQREALMRLSDEHGELGIYDDNEELMGHMRAQMKRAAEAAITLPPEPNI